MNYFKAIKEAFQRERDLHDREHWENYLDYLCNASALFGRESLSVADALTIRNWLDGAGATC